MLITRKIGSLVRGKATPFQVFAACFLGAMLGSLPGFQQAPALVLFWTILLLVLNASLFLAGIVGLLAKLILLVAMPIIFEIGRLLIEGPLEGLFRALVNAPVTAYSGLDYYVVAGGQLMGAILGIVLGIVLVGVLQRYRRKMAELSQNSERLKRFQDKKWAKATKFVFLGGGKGTATYEELLGKKIGNPIRIWGAALVVILIGGLYFGFSALAGPLMTSLAKSGLEAANGATVDVESVSLKLNEGKLEATGLAMADPKQLDTNLFSAKRIVADIDARDLLRKRFAVELLTLEDAATGSRRDTPGELIGPAPKGDGSALELPDFNDLDSLLVNAKEWKERLSQAKRWLDKLSGGEEPGEGETKEKQLSWKEELNSRIQSLGYAHVKADFLTEGSPAFWVRRLEAKGVSTPYLDNAKVDVVGQDISTHPKLVSTPPTLSVVSENGRLNSRLSLGGAAGSGQNELMLAIADLPVDQFAASIKSEGQPPISGGTMDLDISGSIDSIATDLVAKVTFDGTTARIGGKPVSLNGVSLPLEIKGPLDRPGVKLESKALEKILVSAGKQKLLEEATKKLGIGDGKEGTDGEKKTDPGSLLKGILKGK